MTRTLDRKILLVESEPALAEITSFRLELLGYRVEHVRGKEAALEAMRREAPDLVLVDIASAEGQGHELTNCLANDPDASHIPVMALSSNADVEEVQRAFVAGAREYLVTPYDPVVLESKLEKLLS